MAPDQQLHTTIDRILSALRDQLAGPLQAYADELGRAAAAERARAVEQATEELRRQAQEQLAQLRETARRQNDDLRRSAETQIGDLRRLLDDIRGNAQQQIDAARKTLETEVAAARRKADADVEDARRVAQAQVEDVQRAADARLAELQREVEAVRRERTSALEELQQAQRTGRQQADRALAQLAADIASLDDAESLGGVLDRLAQAAVHYCDRAAVLTVHGARLREWRLIGFGGRSPDERVDLALADAGLAAAPVRGEGAVMRAGRPLPPFAASTVPGDAAALPVSVGGAVVAVVYADVSPAAQERPDWTASLEVLSRHAGRVLETLTVRQATGVPPLAHTSQAASPSAGIATGKTTQSSSRSMP